MKKFLLFLSKTDSNIIHELEQKPGVAGHDAKQTHVSLGIMVFITGVLAFLSGGYALYTAFQGWVPAVCAGLIYSCMIMAFDREIVGSSKKSAVLVRIPLALFIGVAVALPLEMRLLQQRIDKRLREREQTENKVVQNRRDDQIDKFRQKTEELQNEIQKYRAEINKWGDAMEAEDTGRQAQGRSGLPGKGVRYEAAKQRKEQNEALLSKAETDLNNHIAGEQQIINEARQIHDERFITQTYDFLSRFEALELLKSESSSAWKISWGLRLLFIFIELFPALMKLFIPDNAYTTVIEADRAATITAINQSANNQMQGQPQSPPRWPAPALKLPHTP